MRSGGRQEATNLFVAGHRFRRLFVGDKLGAKVWNKQFQRLCSRHPFERRENASESERRRDQMAIPPLCPLTRGSQ
jgi:hypothetical protein